MAKTDSIAKGIKEMRDKTKKRNFVQGIDLVLALKDIDVKKPENRLNDELVLPVELGKEMKLTLIATGELALQGKKVADKVITKEDLKEFSKDKKALKAVANESDFFVAQSDLMVDVGKTMGSVLGPRGKMPRPVPPNADLKPLAERLKKTIKIKTKDTPLIQISIGTEALDDQSLTKNTEAVLNYLEEKLEKGIKNIHSVYIKASMGPSVKLEVS